MTAHMHIGATLVFQPPAGGRAPSVDELRARSNRGCRRCRATAAACPSRRTGGLHWPHWVEDAASTSRATSGEAALPAPGGRERARTSGPPTTGRTGSTATARCGRWRCSTGLEGGCWALCTKTHHCMVDGVGSVDAAYLLLDTDAATSTPLSAAPEALATARGRQRRLLCPRAGARSPTARAPASTPRCTPPSSAMRSRGRARRRADRPRRARRRAPDEPQRPDRRAPALRRRSSAARRRSS